MEEKNIMNKTIKRLATVCPSCHSRIHFGKAPHLRDIIICQECSESLEVVRLSPLKVDWSLLDDDDNWADTNWDNPGAYYERDAPYD